MVELLYYGGLRLSELTYLKISNFDERNQSITFVRKGGYVHTLNIHNAKTIFKTFTRYMNTHLYRESDCLFPNKKGLPLSTRAVYNTLMRIMLKSGCSTTELTPHSFRKACATNLYLKSKDLLLVRDYLNHADAKVTQTYIELPNAGQ